VSRYKSSVTWQVVKLSLVEVDVSHKLIINCLGNHVKEISKTNLNAILSLIKYCHFKCNWCENY
jgi:hypothetical protein